MRGNSYMRVFASLAVVCILLAGCKGNQCISNYDCSEPTPVCFDEIGRCVECTEDVYCSDPKPACDRNRWVCAECFKDFHCDDGDDCSIGGCVSGRCQAESLPDGTPCYDFTACTTGDACLNGRCVGEPVDCDDGDPCTLDACHEDSGECRYAPALVPGAEGPPGDASCGNGVDDDCDGFTDALDLSCVPCTGDSDCNDGNRCTGDACRQGACENAPAPDGSACGDGLYCTIEAGCLHGFCSARDRDCDDDNPCTLDLCSEAEERCINVWQEAPEETDLCGDRVDTDCDGLTDECCYSGGAFEARVDLPLPVEDRRASSVVAGDFNQDGLADLAVVSPGMHAVGVLISTGALAPGSGPFAGWVIYPVIRDPLFVAAADFDANGTLDLAVAGMWALGILTGEGNGTFTARGSLESVELPGAIIAADFNRDGALDLAVAGMSTDEFLILPGTGSGDFLPGESFQTGNEPRALLAADFDSDGALEMVVANFRSETIWVYPGWGDGTFTAPREYATGGLAGGLAAADFNSDGILDLVVTNMGSSGESTLSVFPGNGQDGRGDGTFAARTDYPCREAPSSVVVADFDSEWGLDLAVSYMRSSAVAVFPGWGDGRFGLPQEYEVQDGPVSLAIADVFGDGGLNLALGHTYSCGISLLLVDAGCP